MKSRSPVLGYNHNVRYADRLWHVQTEDSGVNNPHIFTHLFHEGTILATKRIDYDPASEVAAVQKVMQTQHKAMLRELKAGAFDEKITKFFGEPVVKNKEEESTDPNAQPPIAVDLPATTIPLPVEEANALIERSRAEERPAPSTHDTLPPIPSPITREQPRPASPSSTLPRIQPAQVPSPPPAAAAAPRPSTTPTRPSYTGGIGRRPQPGATPPKTAEGVVVARPAVVIGGEAQRSSTRPAASTATRWHAPTSPQPPQAQTAQPLAAQPAPKPPSGTGHPRPPTQDNIFGGDLISEKSLDEVILAYLSEDLNEK